MSKPITNARQQELFSAIEREAKQAQKSLELLKAFPEKYAPQQEHVDSAIRTIASCLRVLERSKAPVSECA